MNCVRRHLSAVKGGRLAAACHPAKVVTLLVSDVPGDDPVDIASGPTVADPTTCEDAMAILGRYHIDVPARARALLDIAGDTDGVDRIEELGGAFLAPDTLSRARARGVSPRERLDENDGHGFFEAIDDSLVTGPTLTKLNDFRAILITADAGKEHPHAP